MSLPRYNLPAGTFFEIDGARYQPMACAAPGRALLLCLYTGEPFQTPDGKGGVSLPTEDDLDELKIAGRLKIALPESLITARRLAASTDLDALHCAKIDPKSPLRLTVCRALDDAGVPNGVPAITNWITQNWNPDFQKEFGGAPNPHSVKRWRSERGTAGHRSPRDMLDMTGRVPRAPYLSDALEDLKHVYALRYQANRGSMKTAYARVLAEIAQINDGFHPYFAKPTTPYRPFSYDTFRRACHAVDGIAARIAKHGHEYVNATMMGAGQPLTANRILEKVIIDHTVLDCFTVVDPKFEWATQRAWLTFAVDVYSRCVLAWLITLLPPSYWTVYEVIRRMLLPKRPPEHLSSRHPILKRICGRPTEIIVDNGLEFRSASLRDFAGSFGSTVRFAPLKEPRYKAIGERAFGTVPPKMLEEMPGRTLGVEYSRKAGYDPQASAEVTLNGLEAIANWSVAEYHLEPHDGLKGRSPALMFLKSANQHGIDMMTDISSALLEVLEVEDRVQITKSGARMFRGLRYYSAVEVPGLLDRNLQFEGRRQSKSNATIHTKVKFNPMDISRVWAWDRASKKYVELICQDSSYADGLPLAFHYDLLERAQQEGREFSTDAERASYRSIRIAAVKALTPKATASEREALARLAESPRVKEITGNLVSLHYDMGTNVTADQFIGHDVASKTSFDAEVLHGPTPPRRRDAGTLLRDRRDAGAEQSGATAPRRRNRRSAASGGSAA